MPVLLLRPPGVYRPQADTWFLTQTLRRTGPVHSLRLLDLCTGTGVMAVAAALAGARVTAVDLSLRAVLTARANAALHRTRLRVLHGYLADPVAGEEFDVVLANPPYVARPSGRPWRHSPARAWDAGPRGREVIDHICGAVRDLLAPGGTLLMVHSDLCGVEDTLRLLRSSGLHSTVAARLRQPFGPVLTRRAPALEACGLIEPGRRHEELVVIRAQRPVTP